MVPEPVAVIGLGYVGNVVAASLAASGRRVIGVDRRPEVVEALAAGKAPIPEPDLQSRIDTARALGTLTATTSVFEAVVTASASLVCVGTPLGDDGKLDETDLVAACEQVARAVPAGARHVIVIRSTVSPGTHARLTASLERALGEPLGERVSLALNPEFLREGSAVRDLEAPELVVYATDHDDAATFLEELYAGQRDVLTRTEPATAELLKLVNNAWHALKVGFANEVARAAAPAGVDPFQVMELLCRDTKLNASGAYLRPGLPFGGACLTKDVASLSAHASRHGVDAPLIGAILSSNRAHLDHLVEAVLAHEPKQIAIVGVGFKPGAADVRDSAPVKLVRELLDRGVHVTVADSAVLDARVPPLGLAALREALGDPRAQAAPSVAHAVAGADVVVVGHPGRADRDALVALRPKVPILDAGGELSRHLSDDERELLSPVVLIRH